ncbi:hypothetical protein [Levilactobacillus angrenensis]|uniref:DUF1056 family protein n=1 Tax=Levilactobacillus angrenensis TaxID=2486020 RepID=A0ABW1UCE4_9LACO|nr:hypothetical protein [Levilactobacillus angrenensis]
MRFNRLFYRQIEFWLGVMLVLAGLVFLLIGQALTISWWLTIVEILIGVALIVDCLIDSWR